MRVKRRSSPLPLRAGSSPQWRSSSAGRTCAVASTHSSRRRRSVALQTTVSTQAPGRGCQRQRRDAEGTGGDDVHGRAEALTGQGRRPSERRRPAISGARSLARRMLAALPQSRKDVPSHAHRRAHLRVRGDLALGAQLPRRGGCLHALLGSVLARSPLQIDLESLVGRAATFQVAVAPTARPAPPGGGRASATTSSRCRPSRSSLPSFASPRPRGAPGGVHDPRPRLSPPVVSARGPGRPGGRPGGQVRAVPLPARRLPRRRRRRL